ARSAATTAATGASTSTVSSTPSPNQVRSVSVRRRSGLRRRGARPRGGSGGCAGGISPATWCSLPGWSRRGTGAAGGTGGGPRRTSDGAAGRGMVVLGGQQSGGPADRRGVRGRHRLDRAAEPARQAVRDLGPQGAAPGQQDAPAQGGTGHRGAVLPQHGG